MFPNNSCKKFSLNLSEGKINIWPLKCKIVLKFWAFFLKEKDNHSRDGKNLCSVSPLQLLVFTFLLFLQLGYFFTGWAPNSSVAVSRWWRCTSWALGSVKGFLGYTNWRDRMSGYFKVSLEVKKLSVWDWLTGTIQYERMN